MMRRRRALMALACGPLFWAQGVYCASDPTRPRIGILYGGDEADSHEWKWDLEKALTELGWTPGRKVELEWRYAARGTSYDALARELVKSQPRLLITMGTPRTQALQNATRTIPIVTELGDPVASGFAKSIVRPGGNVTGLSHNLFAIAEKQIELFSQLVPGLARVAVVAWPGQSIPEQLRMMDAAAAKAGLALESRSAASVDDLRKHFAELREKKGGAYIGVNFTRIISDKELAALAIEQRVPTLFTHPSSVGAGGLMSYGAYYDNNIVKPGILNVQIKRTAAIVDKVLRGLNPAEIPFELPGVTLFVINGKTAKALGIEIPKELRLRADEVID